LPFGEFSKTWTIWSKKTKQVFCNLSTMTDNKWKNKNNKNYTYYAIKYLGPLYKMCHKFPYDIVKVVDPLLYISMNLHVIFIPKPKKHMNQIGVWWYNIEVGPSDVRQRALFIMIA
jgi:hypothetical protein